MPKWPLVPTVDAFVDATGGNAKLQTSEYLVAGRFPVIDQGQQAIAGYTDDAEFLCRVSGPVVLFGDHTRVFKYVDFPFALGADGVKVLAPRPGWDGKYLFWALRDLEIPSAGYSRHFKFLKEQRMPHPPIEDQRRIAAVLDEAEGLTRRRLAASEAMDALSRSMFVDLFGRPLGNERHWPERPLGDLGRVVTGRTPPTADASLFGGPIPFITPGDLTSGLPPKRTLTEAGAQRSRLVRAGATLVCCIGTIGKVGRAVRDSAFNQQINAVEWNSAIHDDYGHAVLEARGALIAAAGKSTTLPILNKSDFQRLTIPVPPFDLQLEYARRVQLARDVVLQQSAQLVLCEELLASLQDRAFRGDL